MILGSLGHWYPSLASVRPREVFPITLRGRLFFKHHCCKTKIMAASTKAVRPKRRGRPPTGQDPVRFARMPDALWDQITEWAKRQHDQPSWSEALRRLVEKALASEPKGTRSRR